MYLSSHRNFVILVLLIMLACLLVACSNERVGTGVEAIPSPKVSSAQSTTSFDRGSDLASGLDQLLNGPEYAEGRWGVAVVTLPDGKLLYGRNQSQLFTPASNMKIYTTAVALDMLGSNYRWRTSVYADKEPAPDGTINGDLVLYGRGAPDLVAGVQPENTNSLDALAADLSKRGVKRVRGNVVGDESFFRGENVGDGWQQNDLQWYYGAEASALSINDNSVELRISPAARTAEPAVVSRTNNEDQFIDVKNSTVTVARGEPFRIGVQRGLSNNDVVVWGEVPLGAHGIAANLSVHNPALWAATLFIRALQAHGIEVEGKPAFQTWRMPESKRFSPGSKYELGFVTGRTLGEITNTTNKHSINLYAELILRTLGRERNAMLSPVGEADRERGDEEAGVQLVRDWLNRAGLSGDSLAIHDGSGLSRLDMVTPEASAELLAAITRTAAAAVFKDSLPVSGKDGTLKGRLTSLEGRVTAKTGAIIYDHSLSGYLVMNDGRTVAFSVMSNDFISKTGAIPLIDRIVEVMSHSFSGTPKTSPKPPVTENQR